MKTKIKYLPYEKVKQIKTPKHKKPCKPWGVLKLLIRIITFFELKKVNFKYSLKGINKLPKQPCLILMNHSCFLDPKIVAKIFKNKSYNIVCTMDALIGKGWLMRKIGCIPTKKFVHDITLIKDMNYALTKLKSSVLMYPEAGYSFDGTSTKIPKGIGRLVKTLNVPVLFVKTFGAFLHDPLYNCLQQRKVDVSAEVSLLISNEDLNSLTVEEMSNRINQAFTFDEFEWQLKNKIEIDEPFRADGLHKILYKCPNCLKENTLVGKGIHLTCNSCNIKYELTTLGQLKAINGKTEYPHIPNWYNWERCEVKKEIESGNYLIETKIDIAVLKDYKAFFMIGEGKLIHNENGFVLESSDGSLKYTQSPITSYSVNADYYFYEIGDVICIGDKSSLYYCFIKDKVSVTKIRMAVEELYKLKK